MCFVGIDRGRLHLVAVLNQLSACQVYGKVVVDLDAESRQVQQAVTPPHGALDTEGLTCEV